MQVTTPALLERCHTIMATYVADSSLRGNFPFPRYVTLQRTLTPYASTYMPFTAHSYTLNLGYALRKYFLYSSSSLYYNNTLLERHRYVSLSLSPSQSQHAHTPTIIQRQQQHIIPMTSPTPTTSLLITL
jgi:hypothetical protein